MNRRLGRFGQREMTACAALTALNCGCFSIDKRDLYRGGNILHFATLLSLFAAFLLLELLTHLLRKTGAKSLGALCRRLPVPVRAVSLLLWAATLLLTVMLPQVHFLQAMTGLLYPDAEPVVIALYLLPCLILPACLGMETLVRTSRVLLPVTVIAALLTLASYARHYRIERLVPFFTTGHALLGQSVISLLRFLPPVLILLSAAPGGQGLQHVRRACRTGLWIGGGLTVALELCLGLTYRYTELSEMEAPLYRLIAEIDTVSAAIRLDRILLFVWTTASMLVCACALYAASLLLSEVCDVGDIRPPAVLLGCASVFAALLLTHADGVLRLLERYGWVIAVLPVPFCLPLFSERRRLRWQSGS